MIHSNDRTRVAGCLPWSRGVPRQASGWRRSRPSTGSETANLSSECVTSTVTPGTGDNTGGLPSGTKLKGSVLRVWSAFFFHQSLSTAYQTLSTNRTSCGADHSQTQKTTSMASPHSPHASSACRPKSEHHPALALAEALTKGPTTR